MLFGFRFLGLWCMEICEILPTYIGITILILYVALVIAFLFALALGSNYLFGTSWAVIIVLTYLGLAFLDIKTHKKDLLDIVLHKPTDHPNHYRIG
jgi:hypothetical protein